MGKSQRGVSLTGLLIVGVLFIALALIAMKIVPALLEFQTAKKAINSIVTEGNPSVADVRKSFDARATIDDITAITAQELEITKDGGEIVVSFAYRKEVPFTPTFGVYFNFKASSKQRER